MREGDGNNPAAGIRADRRGTSGALLLRTRHHGRLHNPLGGVLKRHHAITVDHALMSHDVATIRRGDAKGLDGGGEVDVAGIPAQASSAGKVELAPAEGPADVAAGDLMRGEAGA